MFRKIFEKDRMIFFILILLIIGDVFGVVQWYIIKKHEWGPTVVYCLY